MPESVLQEIICCMGQPVAGNPTQFMMQRALVDAGLDWCCLTLEVAPEDLADAIRGARAMGFRGINLTLPHKVAALELLDGLSDAARLMGAVNCIHRVDRQLWGENTDGKGFLQSLGEVAEPAGKRVLLLGAGGAARAIAVELALARVGELLVANRTPERAHTLVELLAHQLSVPARALPWEGRLAVPEETDIVINATSLGVLDSEARVPLDVETLRRTQIVADVVFNPTQTWLLQEAQRRHCTTLNGLGMLVNQAAIDFRIWTGIDPKLSVMREAVEEYLEI